MSTTKREQRHDWKQIRSSFVIERLIEGNVSARMLRDIGVATDEPYVPEGPFSVRGFF
jgi:hypothetical protein